MSNNCCNHCHDHEHEHHHHDEHCGCGHTHNETNSKTIYIRLGIGIILSVLVYLFPVPKILLIIPYLILGYDVLWGLLKNIIKGKIFDEQFLMGIATLGAILLGEYIEAVAVMFFYQLGELLGDITADKCKKSIKEMFDFAPDTARRITEAGFETVKPAELKIGDKIAVFAGEQVPCDGIIADGSSFFNTSSLTGESLPKHITVGQKVLGGYINTDSTITVTITDEYKNSSIAKVAKMLDEASKNKAESEKFIRKFARRYTPVVVIIAILSAIFLPLLPTFDAKSAIYTALMFLVSCPCALVISIPLTFFAGIGRASKNRLLFRGNNSLEKLRKIKNFAFDKTGTLTEGNFSISENTLTDSDFSLLANLERYSNHPLAQNIGKMAEKPYLDATGITELKGLGISATIDGKTAIAGNEKFIELKGISDFERISKTAIHLAVDGRYCGYIALEDAPKPDAKETIEYLKQRYCEITLLSGDGKDAVGALAEKVGIEKYHSNLLPHDKVRLANELKTQSPLCYIGDGINDAPVLALSDIGISMGGIGSDIAIANADIILLDDNLTSLKTAIKISKKTMSIVYQNITFSIGVKVLVMILGLFGFASMPLAIFADVGVMILAIFNAIRAMR